MSKTDDAKWLDQQVKIFEDQHDTYDVFAKTLTIVLQKAASDLGIVAMVQARPKSIPSFAEKCIRKRGKYLHPAHQLTDLCGARVIVESKDQIKPICDFISNNFEVDAANSEDTATRLKDAEFGYQSVHYVVSFKENVSFPGAQILADLTEWRTPEEAKALGMAPGPIYKAEIQVRTLLQHAWASLVHDNIYKSEFKAPPRMVRIAHRTSALLEEADNSFQRLLEGIGFYKTYYGAYMTKAQNEAEIATLTAVMQHDAKNPALAHKIARHALAIEDWNTVLECLKDYEEDKSSGKNGILRDLAIAKVKLGIAGGLELLDKATRKDTDAPDVDALCAMGDALLLTDKVEAGERYRAAYRLKPNYPRVLRSYIFSQILNHCASPRFISLMRPNLDQAVTTCQEWAMNKVYLPQAHFDAGFFLLLQGDRPYESLNEYAKAVVACENREPILEACGRIEEVQDAWNDAPEDIRGALRWIQAFLLSAVVAKIHAEAAEAADHVDRLKQEIKVLKKDIGGLQGSMVPSDLEKLENLKKNLEERTGKLSAAKTTRNALRKEARVAPAKYLANTDFIEKRKRCVVSEINGCTPAFDAGGSIVIVAGGCDINVAQKIMSYQGLFKEAFEGYVGTIVSGGTQAGISALVGDLEFEPGKVSKVAYLPSRLPEKDVIHSGYDVVRRHPGDSYTPLGPIQVWIDLLASGVVPREVRLIGINGGELSAFEYRLALAMGAKVGVLRESGREATKIADDPDWQVKNLLLLPTDKETMRLFVMPPMETQLTDADILDIAREAHEKYRHERSRSLAPAEPGLCEWDKLLPHIQESNRQQAAHIEAKLKRVGLAIRPVKGRDVVKYPMNDPELIETLAEIEHARWNMERLLDGWTQGERDPVKKTSPYLIPWNELPDGIKKYDRDAVADIPFKLAKYGFEVYKP